jgi:sugar (pentulose or hexulose) kinase
MNCFIGIDIGTSTIKCILITEYGQIISHAKERNIYLYKGSGKIEFDAEERYGCICTLIKTVIREKPGNATIKAICFTGASGNPLLLDKDKKPIGNAVSWQDTRAEQVYKNLLNPFSGEYIHSVCGWPLTGSFPLSHFAWLKEYETAVYHSAEYCVTWFVYFNYRLSGSWVMDYSTATTFYLQDQLKKEYHKPFLDYLNIDESSLPELVKSGNPIGKITHQSSLETGLPEGTVVVAGAFDHPTAAIGTGMTGVGDLLISGGTSWVGFMPVKSRELALEHNMLIDPFLSPDGPWGGMFSFTSIGTVINKYIDLLFDKAEDKFERFDRAVLDFSLAENECHFDILQTEHEPEIYMSDLLTRYNKSQISSALMESMAGMIAEKINYVETAGMGIKNITMAGGFSGSKAWPDVLRKKTGLPVHIVPLGEFSGCFGAAVLAGIGVGIYKDESEGFKKIRSESVIT